MGVIRSFRVKRRCGLWLCSSLLQSTSQRLLAFTEEIIASRNRLRSNVLGLSDASGSMHAVGRSVAPPIGSLENGLARLQEYVSHVESRVVARFDDAVERRDLASMRQCATISEADGKEVLLKRFGHQAFFAGCCGFAAPQQCVDVFPHSVA